MSFGSFLSHGGRPTNGRKRKGVDEYAAQNQDFTARSIIRDGQTVRILVCRFCCQSIGARSDRIKEHLGSNRHQKSKLEAFRKAAAENGKDLLSQEDSDSVPPGLLHLPEPPIVMVKYPGKTLEFSGSSPAGPHSNCSTSATHLNTSSSSGSLSFGGAGEIPKSKDLNSSSSNNPVPTAVPPHQLLCVKWSSFESNIISMFAKLRSAELFVDATLWCEGKTIKCHKMILSACSTYFEKLFTENPNPHPIIFLTEMRFWEISALVEFMYRGEVSIHKENLQSLLKAAVSLQIKGLGCSSENDGDTADDVGVSQSAPGTPGDSLLDLNDNSRVDLNTTPSNSSSGGASLSLSQQYLLNSMNMGMKNIMNNRTSTPLGFNNSNNSLTSNNNSLIKSSSAPKVKRRKKKTPGRIYFPRTALPLPLFNDSMAAQGQQQQVQVREAEKEVVDMPMMDMRESEEPGNCSDDSMVAHERNKVDVVNKAERGSYHHPEMTYKVEEKHCEKNDQMDEEQTDCKEVAGGGGGGRGSVIVGGDDRKGHPGTGDEEYSENTLTADESGAVVLIRNTSIVSPAAAEWERLEQKWWYKNNNNNSK